MRKARGYSGYYNGIYLRSSLEFAYAYYLDYQNIDWKYEIKLYQLNDSIYKPDFYIYNKDGSLKEIVEVKGSGFKEQGLVRLKEFSLIYSEPIRIVSYKDIVKLYQESMPLRFHRAKRMWIEDYGATLGHTDISGENNPMYGRKQTDKTKQLISLKAKERFKPGSLYLKTNTQKMIDANRKNGFEHTKKDRVPRVSNVCKNCEKVFVTRNSEKRDYCNHKCFVRSPENKERMSKVAKVQIDKYEKQASEIRKDILSWATENKEDVLKTKLNRINDTFSGLYDFLDEKYGIVDKRTISKAIFGKDKGRKEFVLYLKEYVTT